MATADQPALYNELLDLLADAADRDRLLAFQLPPDKQARLDALLAKNRDGSVTDEERGELEEFERLEHLAVCSRLACGRGHESPIYVTPSSISGLSVRLPA